MKTSFKTRIMSLVAAAVMTCSVAAVSMASASAATADTTQSVGYHVSGDVHYTTNVESKFGSYIALYVWNNEGTTQWIKPRHAVQGGDFFHVSGDFTGAKFVRVKGYREPNWNDDSIMATSRDYSINEVLNNTIYLPF